ncbi:MAG: Gfo/Idh/MocA family oxidoreductase [Candidatus Poribacteria bacterium]|nr:Gfo/Idh/MocA family oxidoreductase [Candidatus Poribacteria bacterium]
MTLRAGIVGCGGISRSHATAYANLEGVTLAALCDINPAALNTRADEYGVPNRYTDYEEMFRKETLDVVSVCTHAPLHAPVAIAAAKAGLNVLSEKPLSIDLQTADQMIAACKESGVRLAVSHQYRFTPIFRHAKEWIESGRLGELRCIREVGKGREAGFELMEMGVHYFDEMDFFMEGIEWIHAQITYQGHEVGAEDIMHSSALCKTDRRDNGMVAGDTMMVHLGGKHGASGLIELYRRESTQGWMMGPHILGDSGQLMIKPNPQTGIDEMWHCPFDVSFAAHTPQWERVTLAKEAFLIDGKPWPDRHSIWSVRDMVNAIRDNQQPELGGANALTSLECVSAVYESHFTGARAYLPLRDRRHPLVKRLADHPKTKDG